MYWYLLFLMWKITNSNWAFSVQYFWLFEEYLIHLFTSSSYTLLGRLLHIHFLLHHLTEPSPDYEFLLLYLTESYSSDEFLLLYLTEESPDYKFVPNLYSPGQWSLTIRVHKVYIGIHLQKTYHTLPKQDNGLTITM